MSDLLVVVVVPKRANNKPQGAIAISEHLILCVSYLLPTKVAISINISSSTQTPVSITVGDPVKQWLMSNKYEKNGKPPLSLFFFSLPALTRQMKIYSQGREKPA